MNRKWLILDCNYLCHRAKHVMGSLEFLDTATGVIYGFLRDVITLQERYNTKHIIFTWDYGRGIRQTINPEYKAKRREKEFTEEELEFENAFRKQMDLLRTEYLKEIGFRNILFQKGYEADDVIASVCSNLPHGDYGVIISADHDLFQLLSPTVCMYVPQSNKRMTKDGFIKEFNIKPKQWAKVKALAGCSSDNVIGIKGVGEKTAIKYMTNNLNPKTIAYKKISKSKDELLKRNLPLVQLPFEGTNTFKLKKDIISKDGWKAVCERLGFDSIKDINLGRRRNRK